ncbi:MAG TPA: hypothetical protein VHQ90_10990 [Thermoanaerobaculia bacterium]|nr:hypothetical protein [Thermoanaerobaculia bacterium]
MRKVVIGLAVFFAAVAAVAELPALRQSERSPAVPFLTFYPSAAPRTPGVAPLNTQVWSVARPISQLRLALLSTPNNGSETFLHILQIGQPFPPSVAAVKTLPEPAIRAATLPDGSVLVIADTDPGPDRSFASSLFRLAPGAPTVLLANHVVWASRPLVTPDGRVFIARGSTGPPVPRGIRVDSLLIDEVNPQSGSTRTVWSDNGYVAFLAGSFANNLILYNIGPSGARVLLVNEDTGREKVILPSLPAGNSFSVSRSGDLVFVDADSSKTHWVVERLNLISGKLDQLHESVSSQLIPYEWPQGGITLNDPARPVEGPLATSASGRRDLIDIQAVTADGSFAVAFAEGSSSLPGVVLLDPLGTEVTQVQTPENLPITVAGFVR